MKERAMVSQPMAGLSEEVIRKNREGAVKLLEEQGYEVLDTVFEYDKSLLHNVVQMPVFSLSKAIETMSRCHVIYFLADLEHARGCRIEHEIAVRYGLKIMYETEGNI